jgi:hypothetical protein
MDARIADNRRETRGDAGSVPPWLHALWRGGGRPAIYWGLLLRAVLFFFLARVLFDVSCSTLTWPMPIKTVGIAALAACVLLLFLTIRSLAKVIAQLGIKRLLVILITTYAVAVLIVGLGGRKNDAPAEHWAGSAAFVAQRAIGQVWSGIDTMLQAPDRLIFAATGRRDPIRMPGAGDRSSPPPTPIDANR